MELREVHNDLVNLYEAITWDREKVKDGLLQLIDRLCQSGLLGSTDAPDDVLSERRW